MFNHEAENFFTLAVLSKTLATFSNELENLYILRYIGQRFKVPKELYGFLCLGVALEASTTQEGILF